MSSRLETIGRGMLVIGILAGLGALGVIFGRRIFETPPEPPAADELSVLFARADVIYQVERPDLTSSGPGRTVVLAVTAADDEADAVRDVLLRLRDARWLVTGRGGAVSPDGSVCLTVSPPSSWLSSGRNASVRNEVQGALQRTRDTPVVIDMFHCSPGDEP